MAYKSKVVTVPEGGTAVSTLTGVLIGNGASAITASAITNHGVIVAGSSNTLSTVAPSTSGNRLTSNGTDWTSAAAAGGTSQTAFNMMTTNIGGPADSTSYFISYASMVLNTASGSAATRMYFAKACTLTKCYGSISSGVTGTAENCTLAIRLNNTTDTTVSSTIQLNAATITFSNAALSISISAGDYIEFKFTTPAWVTNPSNCLFSASVFAT